MKQLTLFWLISSFICFSAAKFQRSNKRHPTKAYWPVSGDKLIFKTLKLKVGGEAGDLKKNFREGPKEGVDFIIRGENATVGDHPWIATLQFYSWIEGWLHFCGGTLFKTNKIVTAAHCVSWLRRTSAFIRAGLGWYDLATGTNDPHTQNYIVTEVQIHRKWNENLNWVEMIEGRFDVAILTLSTRAQLNNLVQTLPLAEETDDFERALCTIAGWGETEETVPDILQTMTTQVIPHSGCVSMWGYSVGGGLPIGNSELCTLDMTSKRSGSCYGDSGGPLVCGGKLAGIVSWGASGCLACLPNVFSDVAWFRHVFDPGFPLWQHLFIRFN